MSKFKEFLIKAGKVVPELLDVAGEVAKGNVGTALKETFNILQKKQTENKEAKELLVEFEMRKLEFEQENVKFMFEDRKDARIMYAKDNSMQKIFCIAYLSLYTLLTLIILAGLYTITIKSIVVDNYIVSVVSTIYGGMSMKLSTIVDFLFGASTNNKH